MVSVYQPPIGVEITAIDTPALLLDYGRLSANIDRMAAFVATTEVKLRPHSKTHKCVEIARMQVTAGAVGITCARLSEAEVFAAAGIEDILIANQVVGTKIARLVDLARRCRVTVAVDSAENVYALSAAASHAGVTIPCLVEVNVGMDRCGVEPGEPAVRLARQVASSAGLAFEGLQAYEGQLQFVMPFEKRRKDALAAMGKALQAKLAIEAQGLSVRLISGGGTGTYTVTGGLPWMSELQAGSYATMDARYRSVGIEFSNALTLLATVISRPSRDRAVIDAGLKAVTSEFGMPDVLVEGARMVEFSEEHGTLLLEGHARDLHVGDKLELIPSHGCTTINLHDWLHVTQDGHVKALWAVAARGHSQ
jgi:D-serine deaminase-like pyridoxal phosphate-dependent protein